VAAVVGDAADGERVLWTEDEAVAGGLLLGDIAELSVVHLVAVLPGGQESGGVAQGTADDWQVPEGLFLIVCGLREDDEVALKALLLEIAEGDGVGDAAVEEALAADGDDARDDGHGRGCEDPLQHIFGEMVEPAIDRSAGIDIGGDEMELHRVAVKGGDVEGIETQGEVVVSEARAKDAASGEPRPEAAVAQVVGVAQVIAQDAARLMALVVATEAGARGDTHDAVEAHASLHEDVHDACGEEAAQTAAFEY